MFNKILQGINIENVTVTDCTILQINYGAFLTKNNNRSDSSAQNQILYAVYSLKLLFFNIVNLWRSFNCLIGSVYEMVASLHNNQINIKQKFVTERRYYYDSSNKNII